ncbi:MAG: dethiobiotin synthase [Chitinophagaceae bacterium]|nr:dethiobiotin synthase [Chitinophagaceae bacterium]
MQPVFVTGIGTDVGKTVIAAILTEALEADYWKPVQAGIIGGTDSSWVKAAITNKTTVIHSESYLLNTPASPHLAGRQDGITIDLETIYNQFSTFSNARPLIIEGAGGLLVPLNQNEQVLHLIKRLDAQVVLVSRNYLGSINHSLLTAQVCRAHKVKVAGWVFNDQYLDYEAEIAAWSGYPIIGKVPFASSIGKDFIQHQAGLLKKSLNETLW